MPEAKSRLWHIEIPDSSKVDAYKTYEYGKTCNFNVFCRCNILKWPVKKTSEETAKAISKMKQKDGFKRTDKFGGWHEESTRNLLGALEKADGGKEAIAAKAAAESAG